METYSPQFRVSPFKPLRNNIIKKLEVHLSGDDKPIISFELIGINSPTQMAIDIFSTNLKLFQATTSTPPQGVGLKCRWVHVKKYGHLLQSRSNYLMRSYTLLLKWMAGRLLTINTVKPFQDFKQIWSLGEGNTTHWQSCSQLHLVLRCLNNQIG